MAETTAPPRASPWLGGKWKGRPQSSLWRLLQARRDGDEDLERSERKAAPAASLLPHPTHPSCILEKLLLGTACSLPAHPNSMHSRWGPHQDSAQQGFVLQAGKSGSGSSDLLPQGMQEPPVHYLRNYLVLLNLFQKNQLKGCGLSRDAQREVPPWATCCCGAGACQ